MSILFQRKQPGVVFSPFTVEEAQTSSCIGKQCRCAIATDEVSERGSQFCVPLHTTSFIMKSLCHMPEETG